MFACFEQGRKGLLPPNLAIGFQSMADACEMCPAGKFKDRTGSDECVQCPSNTYNPFSGRVNCTLCPSGKYTSVNGSVSLNNCTCSDRRFDAGTGECAPCGQCMHNEYVVSECTTTSNVQCAVCDPCKSVDTYAVPTSMCKGTLDQRTNACIRCNQESACSLQSGLSNTLYKCYTGNISFDTTICVQKASYKDPLQFACDPGTYQDPFSQDGVQRYTFDGDVYLNRDNSYLADVATAPGVVKIYRTESPTSPLQVALNSSTLRNAWPVIHIYPEVPDTYPVNYRLAMDGNLVATINAPAVEIGKQQVAAGTLRLISSGTWSFDNSAFFIVWMDGMISKAVVHPPVGRVCFVLVVN